MKAYICEDETQLNYVLNFGTISRMINSIPFILITIADFEGEKYDSYADDSETVKYSDLQFQPIYVMDDSDTHYLFIGRIEKVEFLSDNYSKSTINLYCYGESSKLRDKAYSKQYIYESGRVANVGIGGDYSKLNLTDENGIGFNWVTDYFSSLDKGLLLTDRTGANEERTWLATSFTKTFDTNLSSQSETGTYAKTHAKDNDVHQYASVLDDEDHICQVHNVYEMSGTEIADINKIHYIQIEIDTSLFGGTNILYPTLQVQIEKAGSWVTLINQAGSSALKNYTFKLEEEQSQLIKYFTKSGSDYTKIKLRYIITWNHSNPGHGFVSQLFVKTDFIKCTIKFDTTQFSPIQYKISSNTSTTVTSTGINFQSNGVNPTDEFLIGENTTTVLLEAFNEVNVNLEIDSNFDKYIARNMKNEYPLSILQEVCTLENAHWSEMYDENGHVVIKVFKESNIDSSGETITEGDYVKDFKIEREANNYSKVKFYGDPYFNIETEAIDVDNTSPREFIMIETNVKSQAEAQSIANAKLEYLKNLRPSIVLDCVNQLFVQPLTSINLNLTKPTINFSNITIRRVDYTQEVFSEKLSTKIYCGMGHSPPVESLQKLIEKGLNTSFQNLNRTLQNPIIDGSPIVSHSSLTNLSNDDHSQYLNNTRGDARYLKLNGGTMSGAIAMGSNKITGLAAATANGDALRYEQRPIYEDTPTDGETNKAPTSNWAYKIESEAVTLAGVKTFSSAPVFSGGFGSWTTVSSFSNSWTHYNSPTIVARYRKVGDIVSLTGMVKNGTVGQYAFQLPSGYRPSSNKYFSTVSNNAFGRISIETNGNVWMDVGNNAWFSLDGIYFPI